MEVQRYMLWLHDSVGCSWFWMFEYPANVKGFGIDVSF